MLVTVPVNISDSTMTRNIVSFPGKRCFANAYAQSDDNNKLPAVPTTDMKIVLKAYLVTGTRELESNANKS